MRWDAVLHPVGPLPPGAYWLRRAVVLGVPLLLVIIIVALVASGGSHPVGQRATPVTPDTSAAEPTITPTISDGSCADTTLVLGLTSKFDAYPAGSIPAFVVTVKNVGPVSCTRDVGVGARSITIVSGSDRIWDSNDCAKATPDVRTIAAGATISLGSGWNRRRSAAGCASASPAGTLAQAGSYVATASLGTLGPTAGVAFSLS